MAVTGVLLSLEDVAVGVAERRRLAVPPEEGAERLPASALVESAQRALPAEASFDAASIR